MVDQVANFKKVTVSTGYNNTATSIVLATGQGAELPDPSGDNYNVVWYDSTNYPDPADDPNVEIVRITAKTTDTLTVTRNQEGSGASNKNNADATYKMHLGVTAKTITDAIAIENATGMEDQSFTNLLKNGDFEAWPAGSSSAPYSWVSTGTAIIASDSDSKIYDSSVKVTYNGGAGTLRQELSEFAYYAGRTVTMGCWVKTSSANLAKLRLSDGVTGTVSTFHSGNGTWQWLTVTKTMDASISVFYAYLSVDIAGNALFDGAMLVEGSICPAFSPKPLSANDLTIHMQTPQTLTGAGAIEIVTDITHIVTTAADALTLIDGAEGQEKFIVMKTDANDGTLTPTNLGNGTTITFNDVGDSAHLLFTNGAWHFIGGTATLA